MPQTVDSAGRPRGGSAYWRGMTSSQIQALRAAYEPASDRDIGPLIALFTPDTVWRGPSRGMLWWRRTPS